MKLAAVELLVEEQSNTLRQKWRGEKRVQRGGFPAGKPETGRQTGGCASGAIGAAGATGGAWSFLALKLAGARLPCPSACRRAAGLRTERKAEFVLRDKGVRMLASEGG